MKSYFLASLLTISLLAGCGGSEGEVAVYPVSGTVTVSGGPVAGATVVFAPLDKQPTALGRTDTEGNFTLTTYDAGDGAAEGRFAVVISKAAPVESGSTVNASGHSSSSYGGHSAQAASSEGGSIIPEKYGSAKTTPFKKTVSPDGENVFNLEIQ